MITAYTMTAKSKPPNVLKTALTMKVMKNESATLQYLVNMYQC